MTQFEYLYILLGLFTLVLQIISVFHPLLKDVAENAALRRKRRRASVMNKTRKHIGAIKFGKSIREKRVRRKWPQENATDELNELHSTAEVEKGVNGNLLPTQKQ